VVGNVTPKIAVINNHEELLEINKKLKINMVLTSFLHILVMIVCVFFIFSSFYHNLKYFFISTFIFNFYILLSSSILKTGDIYISIKIKKQPFIGSRIILTSYLKQNISSRFLNDSIANHKFLGVHCVYENIFYLYNAYLYFKINHQIDYDDVIYEIIQHKSNRDFLKGYFLLLYQLLYYLEFHKVLQNKSTIEFYNIFSTNKVLDSYVNTLELIVNHGIVSKNHVESFFAIYKQFNEEVCIFIVDTVLNRINNIVDNIV